MKTIRIGTRGSRLALVQAEIVKNALSGVRPELRIETVIIKTQGDIMKDAPLAEIGGKGLFVKDIEKRLIENEIDIAVHSLKDMQAMLPEGLSITAFLEREDARDMLFSSRNYSVKTLPNGSVVGTSSLRRVCQLKFLRPDLKFVALRGNVPTRLAKTGKEVDAVVLAAAGVKRLGLKPGSPIPFEEMIPSPGQGIIAVETRSADNDVNAIVSKLDHKSTRMCALAERSFLAELGADCRLPVAAIAVADGDMVSVDAMLGNFDASIIRKMRLSGRPEETGIELARRLAEIIAIEGDV